MSIRLCSTACVASGRRVRAFGARRDALFELLDAATVAGLVPSLAHLSLTAVHRRRWGSLYDALAAGTMDAPALRELVGRWPLDDGQPIYALDTSVWPRNDAETSPGRGYYYSASRQSAGQPIVAGWSYAWLAQVSFTHDSWTAPLDVRRVAPTDDAHAVAAAQIRDLLGRLPAESPVPLCVFDAGYDPGSSPASWATWMASGWRCWCACGAAAASTPTPSRRRAPAARAARGEVRLRRRGHLVGADGGAPRGARAVRGGAGAGLGRRACQDPEPPRPGQPAPQAHGPRDAGAGRGRAAAAPDPDPQAALAVVARPRYPDLAVLWRAYVHRFDLEHTYRFCKQTLNWTTPRVRHPEQADRWTWLVLLAYTQLRLARRAIADGACPGSGRSAPTAAR